MPLNYMSFRPQRPRIHCSIDVLFHEGALWLTRAVGITRPAKRK